MKISLGQHETAHFRSVDAWIEPNRPAYRGGAVRDNGFLCVAVQDGPQMRLESTSEDLWKLMDAVGVELGRKLWEERRRYDREPYYMAYDHAQYGRLYFTPWVVEGGEPSIAFHTRPDGRYPKEGAVIPEDKAPDQLRALFAHENLSRHGGLIPDTYQIAEAIEQSQRVVDAVIAARAEYSAVVDWDFDKRLNAVHENNLARIAALSAGDKDAAARHVEDGDELLGQYHRAEAVIGFAEPEEPQAQESAAERDDDYDFAP